MISEITSQKATAALKLDPSGRLPGKQYHQIEDSIVEFRYVVADENEYPGFDGRWRVITETDRRDTLRMDGKVAQWLLSLEEQAK